MQGMRWLNLCGLVLAVLIPTAWSMGTKDLDDTSSRWRSYEPQSAQNLVPNMKRHSEGTFTSDFTRYLDKMKAKDFVHWLINTKRFRCQGERGPPMTQHHSMSPIPSENPLWDALSPPFLSCSAAPQRGT
uniref:Glucagon / GIP / secretin / VIP family domain-containing protein n=1 Tax=Amazona collaria TaxID=241587 RepID=A0A8B9FQZ2_9PSIT